MDNKNFSEMGRLGGKKISEDREHMSRIGKLGAAARKKQLEEKRALEAKKEEKALEESVI